MACRSCDRPYNDLIHVSCYNPYFGKQQSAEPFHAVDVVTMYVTRAEVGIVLSGCGEVTTNTQQCQDLI